MLSLEGRQLGNYDVIRRIRSGGMGAVYEGRQRTAFDRRVAIKVILGNYASDPDMRRRFAREAKTVARLHHPHILPLIEFGDEQGMLYLVMPFIDGGTLTGYLRRHLPDVNEVSTIFLQMLDAVEYAHEEELIHRDIKSSNVLLESRRSGPPYAYLADFGLVRTIQQAELESSFAGTPIPLDQVPGTPQYMAPEQTHGIVTTSTDIYALGVLLFQMLTGELPFNDPDDIEVIKLHLYAPVPNPCKLDASIPAELGIVVSRAMAKRPEQRFANIAEMREAFLAAVDGPVVRVDEIEDDDEFEIYELPPRPSPSPSIPLRPSQQLRMQPEPIEFSGQAPARARRPNTTGEPNEGIIPPRPRVTGDQSEQAQLPANRARRAHTTDEENRASLPQAGLYRQRITGDPQEQVLADTHLAAPVRQRAQTGLVAPAGPRPLSPTRRQPPRRRNHRRKIALVTTVVLALLLIFLLIVPRISGVSLFPAGFPLFGSSPIATITVTVKTQTLKEAFVLAASPQTTQPDVNTSSLPDRSATSTASANLTIATSGLTSTASARATGFLTFDNSGLTPVNISSNFSFTANNGVQVRLNQGIVVPKRSKGHDGIYANAPATAIQSGTAGNLAASAINSPCCGGGVIVNNPTAFRGGSNGNVIHEVAQTDLDNVKNELVPGLQQKAQQQISALLQSNEVEADTPTYHTTVTPNHAVGSQATQVTVTVAITATALIYNVGAARDLARQLLNRDAVQSLGHGYQLDGDLNITNPTIGQRGNDNRLYLNVTASGLWAYQINTQTENQWRQVIKGASIPLAQSYLSTRPGITSARIQLPFNTHLLPTSDQQIVFVIQE